LVRGYGLLVIGKRKRIETRRRGGRGGRGEGLEIEDRGLMIFDF
jgi:hypothetical protein